MLQLYDGGGRAAIFGAGVADGLEAANTPKPEVLIANSGGLFTLLSIATGRGGKGLEVFEEFVRRGTLRKTKIFRTLLSTFLYRIFSIPSRSEDMVADVPTVLRIMKEHGFDARELQTSTIECFARVFDVRKGVTQLIDLRKAEDPWNIILQSCTCDPYYRSPNSTHLMDPMLHGPKGYFDARKNFPRKKIIAIENYPGNHLGCLTWRTADFLLGLLCMHGGLAAAYFRREEKILKERGFVARQGDIIIVRPPENFPVTVGTNSMEPLRRGYDMGRKAAEDLLRVLEKE